jgi:hypothetical protein
MGMCCCGSDGEPSDERTCKQIGCDYYEDPATSCLAPDGLCALPAAVATHLDREGRGDPVVLLASGGTFRALYDLRDVVLRKSDLGRQVMALYGEHSSRAVEVARRDPALLMETMRVFLLAASIGREVLRVHLGLRSERRLTPAAFEAARELMQRLRAAAGDGSLDEPARFLNAELEALVDRDAGGILAALLPGKE